MERMLEKMAKQLNAYDEASLMSLWQTFASRVHEFEPTKRWEEAALVLCFIQAVRWKNQLFNYHRLATATPVDFPVSPILPRTAFEGPFGGAEKESETASAKPRKAKVLRFPEK